jgi:hypothetical protein
MRTTCLLMYPMNNCSRHIAQAEQARVRVLFFVVVVVVVVGMRHGCEPVKKICSVTGHKPHNASNHTTFFSRKQPPARSTSKHGTNFEEPKQEQEQEHEEGAWGR